MRALELLREHNHPADPEAYAGKQARARLREGLEEAGGTVAEAVHQVGRHMEIRNPAALPGGG